MKQLYGGLFALLILAMFKSSCTDPTVIGSELLDEDRIEVDFTDTLSVIGTTIKGDTVQTYSPFINQQLSVYLLGDMTDPLFGRSVSTVYTQPRPERFRVNFNGMVLDSIVLALPLDSLGYYGKAFETFELQVERVIEDMPRDVDYFSDVEFATDPMPIGGLTFFPAFDSIDVIDYSTGVPDSTAVPPQLRIPLDQMVSDGLFNQDTTVYENDSTFLDVFKGIKITPLSENNGMIGFDLFALESGIFVYYHDDEGTIFQYQYVLGALSVRAANYVQDRTGSFVEPYIDDPEKGDSLILLQGLEGLDARLEIPNIEDLKGIIVNKAEMVVSVAEVEGDDLNNFDPPDRLILYKKDDDGELVVIDDVILAGIDIPLIFGGVLVPGEDGAPDTYTMNISSHIQGMIDGGESNELFLQAFPKNDRAWRVPLNGAKSSVSPVIVRIAFTRP